MFEYVQQVKKANPLRFAQVLQFQDDVPSIFVFVETDHDEL
jgi:hypothetical protein